MNASESRFVEVLLRELLLLALLGGAAVLFINHGILYFTGDTALRSSRPEAYVVTTLVFYVFVRGVYLVLSVRPHRVQGDLVLCPECGQELADPTAAGLAEHYQEVLTPKPSERDVLAAIALRKAVDEARFNAERRGAGPDPLAALVRGNLDNLPAGVKVVRGTREPDDARRPSRPKMRP
ncbi:MAG: hypothetical protein ACT4OI_03695 [Methanobacteriota archaeon]